MLYYNLITNYQYNDLQDKNIGQNLFYLKIITGVICTITKEITIELQEYAKPCNAKPFPIPTIKPLKKVFNRLIKIGVLKKSIILNSQLLLLLWLRKTAQYELSLISENYIKQYKTYINATSLKISMGYYYITLCPVSLKLCTIKLL